MKVTKNSGHLQVAAVESCLSDAFLSNPNLSSCFLISLLLQCLESLQFISFYFLFLLSVLFIAKHIWVLREEWSFTEYVLECSNTQCSNSFSSEVAIHGVPLDTHTYFNQHPQMFAVLFDKCIYMFDIHLP